MLRYDAITAAFYSAISTIMIIFHNYLKIIIIEL